MNQFQQAPVAVACLPSFEKTVGFDFHPPKEPVAAFAKESDWCLEIAFVFHL